MTAASNYTEQNFINALLRGVTFPLPTAIYIGLHTDDPTDTGGNEVSTANWPAYVRRDAADGAAISTGWGAPVDGLSKNAKQITYPGMNGVAPVTVTHWALYDASTGGNMLCYGALQTARQLLTGDVFVFDINAIEVSLD